jgi:4-hydroxy-tetrahydrodipicolinate reductase
MSIGFNLLLCLSKQLAKMTGDEFDIGILEMHHRNKKDAPSGSALRLGQAILGAKNKDFKENILFFPEPTRARGKIEFASLRGGDVIGDHTVVFASDGERIKLTHKASNRKIFATGAVKAAKWLYGKPAGLYSMEDVFLS